MEMDTTYTLTKTGVNLADRNFSLEVMTAILRFILENNIDDPDDNDVLPPFVQICIESATLDFPINVPRVADREMLLVSILDRIERVLTSKDKVSPL